MSNNNNNSNYMNNNLSSAPEPNNAHKKSNLITRIKTVSVGIPIVVYAILFSPMLLKLIFAVGTFIGLLEYIKMAYSLTYHLPKPEGVYTWLDYYFIFWSLLSLCSASFSRQLFDFCVYVFLFTLFIYQVLTYSGGESKMQTHQLALYILGYMYIVWTAGQSLLFFDTPSGSGCFLLSFFCTWATDACAFFVGSSMGRHKLLPNISPNKSWEGMIAGITGSFIMGFIMYFLKGVTVLRLPNYSFGIYLVVGFMQGVLGMIGDLSESFIKRTANIKDSGSFFPGHGGVLDRIDSLIFAIPFFPFFEYLVLS